MPKSVFILHGYWFYSTAFKMLVVAAGCSLASCEMPRFRWLAGTGPAFCTVGRVIGLNFNFTWEYYYLPMMKHRYPGALPQSQDCFPFYELDSPTIRNLHGLSPSRKSQALRGEGGPFIFNAILIIIKSCRKLCRRLHFAWPSNAK